MRPRREGVPRQPAFLKLWAGQAISSAGSQVTLLALPLTAVLELDASAGQMGLLRAAQTSPFLLFGLVAGVWVDRVRRRPLLIGADVGRMLLLGTIPLAAMLGVVSMPQLYVVGFLGGILTLVFTVAYRSVLPSIVTREQLVAANSTLFASDQVVGVTGAGFAGWLVQVVTAPIAIALDAVSFGMSALFLSWTRVEEAAPAPGTTRGSIWADIGEGLRFVWRTPIVRAVAVATGLVNLFGGMASAVLVLYVTRALTISPTGLGLMFAVGGGGGVLGAVLATRCVRRWGLGPTLIGALALNGVATMFVPLTATLSAAVVPLLALGQLGMALGAVIYSINGVSLLQACTPDRLLGRMTASTRLITAGTLPVGALLGGTVAGYLGLAAVLWVAAGGVLVAMPVLWRSPVRRLHEQPAIAPGGERSGEASVSKPRHDSRH